MGAEAGLLGAKAVWRRQARGVEAGLADRHRRCVASRRARRLKDAQRVIEARPVEAGLRFQLELESDVIEMIQAIRQKQRSSQTAKLNDR